MTEAEFDAAWHALDFTDGEWVQLIFRIDLYGQGQSWVMLGQPLLGRTWLWLVESLERDLCARRDYFSALHLPLPDDVGSVNAEFVRIIDRIKRHRERCLSDGQ